METFVILRRGAWMSELPADEIIPVIHTVGVRDDH